MPCGGSVICDVYGATAACCYSGVVTTGDCAGASVRSRSEAVGMDERLLEQGEIDDPSLNGSGRGRPRLALPTLGPQLREVVPIVLGGLVLLFAFTALYVAAFHAPRAKGLDVGV